jgi:hemin uptake protein HemP
MFSKTKPPSGDAHEQQGNSSAEAGSFVYTSEALFRGKREIQIDHQGFAYRLRITRTGGLILNK